MGGKPDIVDEINFAYELPGASPLQGTLQRARDEILALRSLCERQVRDPVGFTSYYAKAIRADALEDAAKACDARKVAPDFPSWVEGQIVTYNSACAGCAFDVRALKDAP